MKKATIVLALLLSDIAVVVCAMFLSMHLRFDNIWTQPYYNMMWHYLPHVVIIRVLVFYFFGLYQRLWRYAGVHELVMVVSAVTVSSIIIIAVTMWDNRLLPRSIHLISWLLTIVLIGGSRVAARVAYYTKSQSAALSERVLIIGAGDAGAMLARELKQRYSGVKNLVGFLDDDRFKYKQMLYGTKVLGATKDIPLIAQKKNVTEIIIAMPSVRGKAMREIVSLCNQSGCRVKTLPGLYELIDGQITVQQLREVEIDDLLGREPVKLNMDKITEYLHGKCILVTGAGGSIGSELCRQIAKMKPKTILILGKGENSIYNIERELRGNYTDIEIIPIIADVRDRERIEDVFVQYHPQLVFHAAAHKHVPLMELQPAEAVRNNVFGTKVVAETAAMNNAESFILVSTDKAVNPTSVMGATKRLAEMVLRHINNNSKTKFAAVRFGNVLGSRGSVVPLFKKQIAAGGPVTITHPDMVRYFMTIPEATQLILQAGALAKGGEIFVLDMGDPVKIMDLASDMITLSGLKPHEDIEIKVTGIRPGEKLFEELLTDAEGITATKHEKVFVAGAEEKFDGDWEMELARLGAIKEANEVRVILKKIVPAYKPNDSA